MIGDVSCEGAANKTQHYEIFSPLQQHRETHLEFLSHLQLLQSCCETPQLERDKLKGFGSYLFEYNFLPIASSAVEGVLQICSHVLESLFSGEKSCWIRPTSKNT